MGNRILLLIVFLILGSLIVLGYLWLWPKNEIPCISNSISHEPTLSDFEQSSQDGSTIIEHNKRESLLSKIDIDAEHKLNPSSFFGRVVENGPGEFPISGANIINYLNNEVYTTTDNDGLFTLQRRANKTDHISIRAKGFSLALVKLTAGHETPEHALIISLQKVLMLPYPPKVLGFPKGMKLHLFLVWHGVQKRMALDITILMTFHLMFV